MKPEDQQRVLSSMQEGRIIWARFGINKEIQASVSYIITANANSKSGKFRDQDKIDIQSESPFLGPILGRIDLIYIFRKEDDMKYLQGLAHSLAEMDDNYSESLQNEGHNYQFLTRWIEYGKRFENPKFSSEASIMLNQYFVNVRSQDNKVSDRLWRRLRNMATSLARLDHKNTVKIEHAKIVVESYNEQLKYWSQVAVIPLDVWGQAAHEMIKKLEGQKIAFEAEELLKAVCKDNKIIDQYVRPDKTKEYDWSTASNHRVRDIHLRFKEIIAMDARISTIHKVPLTVAWSETYTGDTTELPRDYT